MNFAWLEDHKRIHYITEDRDKAISVCDHNDNEQKIEKIIPVEQGFEILLEESIDLTNNYYVSQTTRKHWAHPSVSLINKEFVYRGELGTKRKDNNLTFTLWSPTAIAIELTLYTKLKKKLSTHKLTRIENGAWAVEIEIKDEPLYYQYKVNAFGKSHLILDPYAQSMESHSPKKLPLGAIIEHNKCIPVNFANDHYVNSDTAPFIGYEVHVRDFTIDHISKAEYKGTYLGFCDHIDHLKELGISHVQLLPIQSYCTVDESNRIFQDDKIETEAINYNWGYDAHHYFIPQGWLSTDSHNPNLRILELKEMIQKLHADGIGVIMDVVYNHIFHESFLEDIAPGCYIRRDRKGNISGGTGAGATLESLNFMTRRLIIDSLKYFQDEFHIDGFRFDLMGFLDIQTMKEIRKVLNEKTILYGEAWEFTDLPAKIATTKTQLPKGIAAFNDSARNSYTGEMSGRGFVQGDFYKGPLVRSGIIGGVSGYKTDYDGDGHLDTFIDEYKYHCFGDSPQSSVNFLSIHDGFTLWDKLALSIECDQLTLKKLMRLSFAMLFTSQGKVVIHGGDEIARTKTLAANDPNPDRAQGAKYLEGKLHENTYKSPDYTNRFDWKRAKDFQDIFEYTKGLIALRKAFPALNYQTTKEVNDGLRFVAERIPNSPKYVTRDGTRHKSWNTMDRLKIKFVGGPPNTSLYIIGEVHGGKEHSKNPTENPFKVDFDSDGYGSYSFTQKELKRFDFKGWEENNALNIKLIYTPGEWDFPEGAYTRLGNNKITPQSIKKEKSTARIDLSKINHIAGSDDLVHQGHIAYFLDNKGPKSIYQTLLVVHNANESYCDINLDKLCSCSDFHILVDSNNAGITPIANSTVEIFNSRIKVPGKSCAVIGCID